MSVEPTHITPELADYVRGHFSGHDRALAEVEAETAALGDPAVMQTGPEQGALLEMLVRLTGSEQAIEIGTFTGYGAIHIARGLIPGGKLICCEIDLERARTARANLDRAGVGEMVEICVGPALETLRSLPEEPRFDFAYLDADKSGYPDYYDELLPRLNPGGLLAIDNVLMSGRVVEAGNEEESVRIVDALNDRIVEDERVDSVMLAMADGLTLVHKR